MILRTVRSRSARLRCFQRNKQGISSRAYFDWNEKIFPLQEKQKTSHENRKNKIK